ncbi:hypothetical protein K1719_018559 [Acacia pycnantha]|nr:hypothetical protein K1719_018559 [Acacia pycnantha]
MEAPLFRKITHVLPCLLITKLLLFLIIPGSASIHFNYQQFLDMSYEGLKFDGDVDQQNGFLQLTRFKIAHGLASALLDLHEECAQCVVNRDIKLINIMLDFNFNAKHGDFGLAQIVDPTREHKLQLWQKLWDIWLLNGNGIILEAVDPRLQGDFDHGQVKCLMIVGLSCAPPDQTRRPSIRQAIHVLNFETTVPSLPSS